MRMMRPAAALAALVCAAAGAAVGVAPAGAQQDPAAGCEITAFVTNAGGSSVSTIDVATRTRDPNDIPLGMGATPSGVAITPDRTTAFVVNANCGTVSTIDVATRTKDPTDIPVGHTPSSVAITRDGTTAWVTNQDGPFPNPGIAGSVSTIDVATRTKDPTDITGFSHPSSVAITPDQSTAFVTNFGDDSVSAIDVATRTKDPTDIDVNTHPIGLAITPNGGNVYVANFDSNPPSVSTIDVTTRQSDPTDIPVPAGNPVEIAFTPPCPPGPPPAPTPATPLAATPRFTG